MDFVLQNYCHLNHFQLMQLFNDAKMLSWCMSLKGNQMKLVAIELIESRYFVEELMMTN